MGLETQKIAKIQSWHDHVRGGEDGIRRRDVEGWKNEEITCRRVRGHKLDVRGREPKSPRGRHAFGFLYGRGCIGSAGVKSCFAGENPSAGAEVYLRRFVKFDPFDPIIYDFDFQMTT